MKEGASLNLNTNLPRLFLLILFLHKTNCFAWEYQSSVLMENKGNALLPATSPSMEPQPFLPSLAPSPLIPFTNRSVPRLSGLCTLNFSAAESMMHVTAVDCRESFAPFLANVICCPQLEANVVILIGQSSTDTGMLALDGILAKHCLSDVEQILVSQGANDDLQNICSIHPSNLTEGSCPVKDINEFEGIVDSSKLLGACEKINLVNECCSQTCQNAISEAAEKIALKNYGMSKMNKAHMLSGHLSRVDDCKSIVLRWLASRLDPETAKKILRGISNCKVNKACPLAFPDIKTVTKDCGDGISNRRACCRAMGGYVSHLQRQSFITNLQALNCATSLRIKLQKVNITENIYRLCHITLKDFSLQVGPQESGCLLPSLPSDATFDLTSGISFVCDLNDNIAAPWPAIDQISASSCNTTKIPALPAAASSQSGRHADDLKYSLPLVFLFSLAILLML